MVAVADREHKSRIVTVFFNLCRLIEQTLERGTDFIRILDLEAANAAPVHIEIERIQLRTRTHCAEYTALPVIRKHHNVRQFESGSFANEHTGRNAFRHRGFRRANRGFHAQLVRIRFEVDARHNAPTRIAVRRRTLRQHHARRHRAEHACRKERAHRRVGTANRRRIVCPEICLGQNHMQRTRCVADVFGQFAPILGLRRELIARDNRPFREIRALRQQNGERFDDRHITPPE